MSRKTRKLMWSVPLIAAVAVIGALALFLTLAPNDASAQSALADEPGTPLNLTVVKDGPTRIELSWDKPADGGNPQFYRVDWSADGKVWRALVPEKNDPGYVDRGLSALETRHYRVFAVNSNGTGPVSNVATETTETTNRPDRPEDVTAAVRARRSGRSLRIISETRAITRQLREAQGDHHAVGQAGRSGRRTDRRFPGRSLR